MTTDYDCYDYWIQLYWLQLVSAVTEEPIEIHDTWKVWFPHKNKENDDSNDNDDLTLTSTMKTMTTKCWTWERTKFNFAEIQKKFCQKCIFN